MKQTKKNFAGYCLISFILTLLGFGFSSCVRSPKTIIPPADFKPYIEAYTGGIISENSTIRVCFAVDFPTVEIGSEIKINPFKFSPSMKGKAYWVNSNTIEFVPEDGELKPGESYESSFRLGDYVKVDKKLEKFPFSFRVQQRQFSVSVEPITIAASHPDEVSVVGEITFSCKVNPDDVGKLFSLSEGDNKYQVQLSAKESGSSYRFRIDKIARKEKEYQLVILINGSKIKINQKEKITVNIPEKEDFSFLYAERISNPQNGISILFSAPLSNTQDMKGLLEIPELQNYTIEVENNKAWIFFDENRSDMVTLEIHEGIRNYQNKALGKSHTISLAESSLKPQVVMHSKSAILPNSKSLLIPFRSVNLYAVDLNIIRIYENNLLTFLQNNSLSGNYELRRSGRLVYHRTLWLDDENRDIHEWQNYSIDLAPLIKQEPGAIYRVVLSFRQEYSAYPCGGSLPPVSRPAKSDLIPISDGLSEEANSEWDIPETYFYYTGIESDWSLYDWKERDNPCHASYYMSNERASACNVMASDIGVIVKRNSMNKLWVAVNNLLDTKPIEWANVKVYDFQLQEIASEKTDKEGFAVMDVRSKSKPYIVVAEYDHQKSYVKVVDGEEQSVSRFDVGGKEIQKGLKGFIYGERGVWRPGDTLHVSFILEDKGKRIPENHPVSLELYNPKGQFYMKQTAVNGLNGFYTFHIPTKQDDPTGFWNAYVKIGGSSFHKSLRMETIKPNRLKINLKLPKVLSVKAKEATAPLSASWLTGAKAANLKVKIDLSLSKVNVPFEKFSQYLFNNPATNFTYLTNELFSGVLDADGRANVLMKLPEAAESPGMMNAQITTRVFEPGGDASFYTQSVPYSPFTSYVGINLNQSEGKSIDTDTEHRFDVVTIDENGNLVDRSDLEYKIYRTEWSWWWEDNAQSFGTYINGTSIVPVASGKLQTVGGKTSFTFKVDYPDWGRFLVYVKDKKSGHATGATVMVDWPEWRGRANKQNPSGVKMLIFSLDKPSYEVGDMVTAIIPASARGRALVSIENGTSILKQEWVEVVGGTDTKYSFTITPEMAPNVYLHVSLLQEYSQVFNELPIRMYGVVPVFISNKQTRLHPVIQMADVLHPETNFNITVHEQSGKPMTYTLAVVDEGLLDLTNFKTPDPWNEFYSKEALGIRTWDMYDDILGANSGKYYPLFSTGGDATLKQADSKANRFKPLVKFIGPFHLNKGEKRTHTLKLPMYVGSVRVMVVAGENGSYGNAEKSAVVRAPLMLLSSLPRVMSVNEEIEVPVNLFAMENEVKEVLVSLQVDGKGANIVGTSRQSLTFASPGDRLISFRLKTGDQKGKVKVNIVAEGNGLIAKETVEIEVRNPNPMVTMRHDKWIKKGEKTELEYGMDGNLLPNSRLCLEISRIPTLDFSRRFDFLTNYQHQCTEQQTSKALPLLFMPQLKEMDEKEIQMTKGAIEEGILQLYSRQLPNGGFVYWPGNAVADEWITSYVGVFFVKAKEKGYAVHATVFDKWKRFQRAAAQNWTNVDEEEVSMIAQLQQQQAFRLYSLALAGVPEYGAMNRMYEQPKLFRQAAYLLAASYAVIGKKKNAEELLFKVRLEDDNTSVRTLYGSEICDKAMLLESYLLMNRDDDAMNLAKELSDALNKESSFDTQSSAFALMAMGQLADKLSGSLAFEWNLNGQKQEPVKSPKALYTYTMPSVSKKGKIEVVNKGEGVLNAAVITSAQLLHDTLPAISNQIALQVNYVDMYGKPIDVIRMEQGKDFRAIVTVVNKNPSKDLTHLALTHILPSGWEIYPESNNEPYSYQDIRDDRVLTYFDLKSGERKLFSIRLHATYSGDFILPAVQCEAMYDTSVMARSKAGRISVIPN